MKIFLLILAPFLFSACALKGSGKKSIDFKYWTVDHNVAFNATPQKIQNGSAQITAFQASERRSVLGRDSWNVNIELILTNDSDKALDLNTLMCALATPKNSSGASTTPSPMEAGNQFIIDKTKTPRVLALKPRSSGKVRLGFAFGSSDLVDQPISLQMGMSTVLIKQ